MDNNEVMPGWMTDGKGIRGDAAPVPFPTLAFPSAKVTSIEPQLPIGGSAPTQQPGGGTKSSLLLPFSILSQQNGSGFQKGVFLNSYLYTARPTAASVATATISGLLTANPPTTGDAGWTTMTAGANSGTPDIVWLEVQGDPVGGFTSAAIKSLGNSDSFGGGAIEYASGPVQKYARLVLAYGYFQTNSPDANPIWLPVVNTHRFLTIAPRTANDNTGANSLLITTLFPAPY